MKPTVLVWLALLAAPIVVLGQPTPPTTGWTVRGNIPLQQFVIYSHRGAGELVPENTLAAFEMGWKLGTVPEADMRTTREP